MAKTKEKPAEKPAKKVAKTAAKSPEKPKAKAKAKAKPMTKAEIIAYMAEKLNMTKKQTGDFLNEFVTLAYNEAKKDFVIPGIGKLSLAQRKKRKARNPRTGEEIIVPAKKVVKFRIAKACKDAILGS
jgi:DNA-binding protein HU-beta